MSQGVKPVNSTLEILFFKNHTENEAERLVNDLF